MRGDGLAAKAAAVLSAWDSEPSTPTSAAMEQALHELAYALAAHRRGGRDRVNRHRAKPLTGIEQYQAEDR